MTIALEANSIESAISVSPTCDDGGLQFGDFVFPGEAIEKPVTIRNEGAEPLGISELSIVSPDTTAFSLESSAPITIPVDDPDTAEPENEAQVVIAFEPNAEEAAGLKSAQLRITNTSNDADFDVCLFGNAGGPRISCSAAAIDFGPVTVGIPSTREYVCTNVGAGDTIAPFLFVERVASGSPEFSAEIRNADGSAGPQSHGYVAGESFTVAVTYAPTASGIDQTTIDITSTDGATPIHRTPVVGEGRSQGR